MKFAALASALALSLSAVLAACGGDEPAPDAAANSEPTPAAAPSVPPTPAELPRGLLLALSTFRSEGGKQIPQSELVVLTRQGGSWQSRSVGAILPNRSHFTPLSRSRQTRSSW